MSNQFVPVGPRKYYVEHRERREILDKLSSTGYSGVDKDEIIARLILTVDDVEAELRELDDELTSVQIDLEEMERRYEP